MLLALLGCLFHGISLEEEFQKQEQITSIHDHCCDVVLPFRMAFLLGFGHGLNNGHIGASHSHAHYHLGDLGDGDIHAVEPLWFALDCHEEIIKVHDGMDSIIHHHKHNSNGILGHICMPAIQQHGNVMIPVQENQWLLVNDNEKSIEQLTEREKTENGYV